MMRKKLNLSLLIVCLMFTLCGVTYAYAGVSEAPKRILAIDYADLTWAPEGSSATHQIALEDKGLKVSSKIPAGKTLAEAGFTAVAYPFDGKQTEYTIKFETGNTYGNYTTAETSPYNRYTLVFADKVNGGFARPSDLGDKPKLHMWLLPKNGEVINGLSVRCMLPGADEWVDVSASQIDGIDSKIISVGVKIENGAYALYINDVKIANVKLQTAIAELFESLSDPYVGFLQEYEGANAEEMDLTSVITYVNGAFSAEDWLSEVGGEVTEARNYRTEDWKFNVTGSESAKSNYDGTDGIKMWATYTEGDNALDCPSVSYTTNLGNDLNEYSCTVDIQSVLPTGNETTRLSVWWTHGNTSWFGAQSSISLRIKPDKETLKGGNITVFQFKYGELSVLSEFEYPAIDDSTRVTVALRRTANGYSLVVNGVVAKIQASVLKDALNLMAQNGGVYFTAAHDFDGAISAEGTVSQTLIEMNGIKFRTLDLSELNTTISSAKEKLASVSESEDGKDIANGEKYCAPQDAEELRTAISVAEATSGNISATQNDVNKAKEALEKAIQTFENVLKTASVDKNILNTSIADAEQKVKNVTVSEDGSGLPGGTRYWFQSDLDTLNEEISAARTVAQNDSVAQNDIDRANSKLLKAIETFESAAKVAGVNVESLRATITEAEAKADAAVISTDGKDLAHGTTYYVQADISLFRDAIGVAKEVLQTATTATQVTIDNARETLLAAIETFEKAAKTANVDKSTLNRLIDEVKAKVHAAVISADGTELADGTIYYLQADVNALTDAIDTAETVVGNEGTTQNGCDAAKETLLAAVETFEKTAKTVRVDKGELNSVIDEIKAEMEEKVISSDGKDLANGTNYYLQKDADTLNIAVRAAETVAETSDATQNAVNAAKTTLEKAIDTFEKSVMTVRVDKSGLNTAITLAQEEVQITVISTDGKDLVKGVTYHLQADLDDLKVAVTAAKNVAENSDATQNAVDAAKAAITEAVEAFKDSERVAVGPDQNPEQGGGCGKSSSALIGIITVLAMLFVSKKAF